MGLLKGVFLAGALLVSAFTWPQDITTVPVLSYYEVAPFKTSEGQGLSYDLVALLNAAAASNIIYKLKHLPRKRINHALNNQEGVIVLFVSPAWFNDKKQTRYHWSKGLFKDGNDVISRLSDPIEYIGIESLTGKVMGALLGRKYGPIDTAVAAGKIKREDINVLGRNLLKLKAGRIDFTILSRTWASYLIKNQKLQNVFYRSSFKNFERHLLISKTLKKQVPFLQEWVTNLNTNKDWNRLLKKYGIEQ